MPFDPRQYMKLMFYTIIIILVCTYVFSNEKLIDVLDNNGNPTFKRVHKKNVYGIKVIDQDGFPIIHEFKLYKSSYTNVEDNYSEAIITNHDVESVQDS